MTEPETPVTSKTGGTKGQKLARFDLVPTNPLRRLAEHFGRGATKYSDRNWEKGYPWSLSYAALQRHLNAFWGGEDWDPEFPDSHHLDAAMFHVMVLREFFDKQKEYDDRSSSVETSGTKEADIAAAIRTAFDQQTPTGRRLSFVQTGRWEIP
jgi:Domain of unknown function (DUF5664)